MTEIVIQLVNTFLHGLPAAVHSIHVRTDSQERLHGLAGAHPVSAASWTHRTALSRDLSAKLSPT